MKIKEFLEKNREIVQLIYGIALIILIPLLIVYNTVFIITKYNHSLDVSLQQGALSLGRSIYAMLQDDLDNKELIQLKVRELYEKNKEFKELTVLEPAGDSFQVIASSKEEDIGKQWHFYYYQLAWMQADNEGLATDSLRLATTPDGEALVKAFSREDRFWLVALPMRDKSGEKKAMLTMKVSSKIIDDLTKYNRNASIYLLGGTVLIVILFLLVAVRLWDYALLYKKIKVVDQMKDEFISMASHELRTPVTGIKGYAAMILEGSFGPINDKVKESVKIIQNASGRLAFLVEDLLNVSRIEQGRIEIKLKVLNADITIKETVKELEVEAKRKKLDLIYAPSEKPMPKIKVDQDRFKQVLINLIGNAIKYTEKGSVKITTAEIATKGGFLEITIKDTGIGMSTKDQERLFEKFYRVKTEKTVEVPGTGLGLWITKQIVELMKGSITVNSIENVGTQVAVRFPIIKEEKK